MVINIDGIIPLELLHIIRRLIIRLIKTMNLENCVEIVHSMEQVMKRKLLVFSLVILSFLFPGTAFADGIIVPQPPVCDPITCPPPPCEGPLPCPPISPISQLVIEYHNVNITIKDQIVVTHIDQVFYNPNDWQVEGTYIFPIPHGAAVSSFSLWIDGQLVDGEILEAEEARTTYENIVRELSDPALLEYADQGAVKAQIFPIPPGGERQIEFEYTQVLTAENGLVRYIYPLNTEKFSLMPIENVTISVDITASSPIRAVYSPSHKIAVKKVSDSHYVAGYEALDVRPDKDFSLYFSLGDTEAFHLVTYRDPSDSTGADGFFLLLLAPKPKSPEVILSKDIILVLDSSGSMEGEKFRQTQDAVQYILKHLNPGDRFNVVSFNTYIKTYAENLIPVSEAEGAVSWVNGLSAVGSTDINLALLESASMLSPSEGEKQRPSYVIFLTDGLPTEGVVDSQQILDNLKASTSSNFHLFTFGVGYDVDTFLLDSLAQDHHGASTYVLPGGNLDELLSTFYAKISTPVLANLKLDFGEVVTYDIYPSPLPDLFEGSQIIIVGRYRSESGTGTVTLTGEINGVEQTFQYPDQLFTLDSRGSQDEDTLSSLPRLWATRKIGHLLKQIRLHGPELEIIDQIVRLSIRYGIITPYTSYLVTEDMPLGNKEQGRIVDEQFEEMQAMPPAPASGQEAVEKAAEQGAMADADVPTNTLSNVIDVVRHVGSRTFVFSEGLWIDTTFDPDQMATVKVSFLSEDYFNLAASSAEIAAGFALGDRVIVIYDKIAYEVVGEGEDVDTITPLPTNTSSVGTKTPAETETPSAADQNMTPESNSSPASPSGQSPCIGGILPLILLPLLVIFRFEIKGKR